MKQYASHESRDDDASTIASLETSPRITSNELPMAERYRDDEQIGSTTYRMSHSSNRDSENIDLLLYNNKQADINGSLRLSRLVNMLTTPLAKRLAIVSLLLVLIVESVWFASVARSSTSSRALAKALGYTATDNPAFLSFLAPNYLEGTDWYFITLRMLGYQLMHAESTRSHYPFLVAVTKAVDKDKRMQLEHDGATVIELPEIHISGHSSWPQFRDVMEKLSLFGLYGEHGRYCFIDADTMVLENMDGIFDDPASQIRDVLAYSDEVRSDEPPLPSKYLFAGHAEVTGHHLKKLKRTQDPRSGDYVNAGFYVFAPGPEIHQYYMWLANHTDRWDPVYPEQNLYNYAHRRRGNMPWTRVQDDWNVFRGEAIGLERGVKSFHSHAWESDWAGHATWKKKFDEMTWFYGNRSGSVDMSPR